jgi:hypothetical protein
MPDLLIDEDKARRIIALILRDHMLPEKANTVASAICSRLTAAMTTPSRPGLSGWRIVDDQLLYEQKDRFTADLRKLVPDADEYLARDLWQLVHSYGRDLPPDVAPPSKW